MAGDGKDPILDFMVVRAPERVADAAGRRRYIRDRVLIKPKDGMWTHVPDDPVDPQSLEKVSPIFRIVYESVFYSDLQPGPDALEKLRDKLLETLRPYKPAELPTEPEPQVGLQAISPPPGPTPPKTLTLRIDDLAEHAHISVGDMYYILPDRLEQLARVPLIRVLIRVRPLLQAAARSATKAASTAFDPAGLRGRLERELGKPLVTVVFSADGHSADYVSAHRALFDCLYLLYLMRRWTTVDMSDLIDGLQLLHAIEALAVDALYTMVRTGTASNEDKLRMQALVSTMPEFAGWDGTTDIAGFPVITSASVLAELLDARPVVHPLLAQLFWFRKPFNDIKPIGVGDLKVVKQWLTAYRPGEISHIHNIMDGESRSRTHRRLEKSEEVFSLSSSRTEEKSRDTQSTERFEVKAEAENVVRASLNVTATANLTYNNDAAKITASASAGFGYTRATEDHAKTAQNFARDVVAKAVERVQSQTASQRTITQTFETEERNSQVFDNPAGGGHISGIYRWIDKEYTAQVYNYGKRMMFEFVVPQPAAFWVESKLRAYENSLDVPQPPFPVPVEKPVTLSFTKAQITQALFASLKIRYDLREIPAYPVPSRIVPARDPQTRGRQFVEQDIKINNHTRTFDCSIVGAAGYRAKNVRLSGFAQFWHKVIGNRISVLLNGRMVFQDTGDNVGDWPFTGSPRQPDEEIVFTSDETSFGLVFRNEIKMYDLYFEVELERMPDTLANWQQLVWDTIVEIEQKKLAADFEEEQLAYQARLSQYQNRLTQIRATAIPEILAGRSDAANKAIIDEEIKKHCLSMLAKEFDTVWKEDVLSREQTLGTREVTTKSYQLNVIEAKQETEKTTVGYKMTDRKVDYPAIAIEASRAKGSVVQFLEQAFEWERLSYVFYPYFWSEEKYWIELMNREDDADPTFTAFLRCGMARVLVAATPAYEDAALYYLFTREPWAGGRSPVIGDPLFIPLHDELRQQTDDRSGGVPDGEPWTFTVPTSLVYLHGSKNALPNIQAERQASPTLGRKSADVKANKTLSAADSGIVQNVTADAVVVALPPVGPTTLGLAYTIRNGATKDGDVLVAVSPNSSDQIIGNGFSPADNKDALNAKSTSKSGDEITLVSNGSTGWFISDVVGMWTREA